MTRAKPLNFTIRRRLPSSAAAWCDLAIQGLIFALLAFMPFALGVVEPWSEAIVAAVTCLIAFCLTLRAWIAPAQQFAMSWALLPIALFIAAVICQLVPLPFSVVAALSPGGAAIKRQLLQDLPNAAKVLAHITIGFYSSGTRHDLRLVIWFTTLLVATLMVFRSEARIKRLLWVIAVIGGTAALLALLQDISGTDKIYWVLQSSRPVANSGPFVAYSNYAQFMNLSMGAALGLLLDRLVRQAGAGSGAALRRPSTWLLIGVMVIGSVTIFLSTSRGGMLSFLCAAAFIVLMLASRRGMHAGAWVLSLVLLVAFVALLYSGFDAIYDRLATLKTRSDPTSGRFQTYQDILLAWRKSPIFGFGLGTHQYVYPMFDRSSDPGLAEHAESDYFELLEEMGVVGLVIVATFIVCIWSAFARALRSRTTDSKFLVIGIGFGLMAVMLHSAMDFGQHLPAIGSISALFCGILLNLGRRTPAAAKEPSHPLRGAPSNVEQQAAKAAPHLTPVRSSWSLSQLAWPTILVALVGGTTWACAGANRVRLAKVASDDAVVLSDRLDHMNSSATDVDYRRLVDAGKAAVAFEPDNVNNRYQLGWYSWRSAWRVASTRTLADGTVSPDALSAVRDVVAGIHQSRTVCPTFSSLYVLAGEIERLALGESVGSGHVNTAYMLHPTHPQVCFVAGEVSAADGKWDDSIARFRRCIKLDEGSLPAVVQLCVHQLDRPDLPVTMCENDAPLLLRAYALLADENARSSGTPGLEAAVAKARELLKAAGDRPDAQPWELITLAGLLRQQKDFAGAIACYRRGLQRDYGQPDWHLAFAQTLADAGENAEAVHEAEICLRMRPQSEAARQLIGVVSARPGWSSQQDSRERISGARD